MKVSWLSPFLPAFPLTARKIKAFRYMSYMDSFNLIPQAVAGCSWEICCQRCRELSMFSVSVSCFYCLVVTMFLGMNLTALDLPDPWDTYTMIAFVTWHVGIDVLLEIHSYCLIRKGKNQVKLLVLSWGLRIDWISDVLWPLTWKLEGHNLK